ncbi:MAG: DoxX family protein [Gemmatimonadaceae bacterium]
MHSLVLVLQLIVALGLLNVWLIRAGKSTSFRGGDATSMKEEFEAYGLPDWMRIAVGTLKVGAAIALVAGIWFTQLVLPAAVVVSVLMVGAIAMHFKVRDPVKRYVPALGVLVCCIVIAMGALR